MIVYYIGSDNPVASVFWTDWAGNLIDFSTGYTFTVKVGTTDALTTNFTKTTGITGAVGSLTSVPQVANLSIQWATVAELNTLTAGLYLLQITALNVADSRQRLMQLILEVKSVLT